MAEELAVKTYVVRLSDEERERLNELIKKGNHPARKLLKARILGFPLFGVMGLHA